jgi:Mg/Co/Ni transporter MgtE
MSTEQTLLERYVTEYPDEIARHAEELNADGRAALLTQLPAELGASVLKRIAPAMACDGLRRMPRDAAAAVLLALPLDLGAALLRRLEPEVAEPLLAALPPDRAVPMRQVLSYRQDTAGAVADPLVLVVPHAAAVAAAREIVEAHPHHLSYYVYVVDAAHRLVGVFDVPELVRAQASDPVDRIKTRDVTWLSADSTLETVFAHPGWHALDAMPVVDADGRFHGVLRHRRMRQLRAARGVESDRDQAVRTVVALGEIYWLGLCGLLQGFAAAASADPAEGGA